MVSNHGGRQVDGAIATLDALPGVVEAVDGRVPVLLDSGVRSGADAFKAIALGATAVLIGRAYVWGLAVAGQAGVREVLENLRAELDLTMALAGCHSLAEVGPETLRDVGLRRPPRCCSPRSRSRAAARRRSPTCRGRRR